MNIIGEFYTPKECDLQQLVEPYQKAFAGPPWFEVSECADEQKPKRCPGGLSRLAIGQFCNTCNLAPTKPAYDPDELVVRFADLAQSRQTSWYREVTGSREVSLAGIAWRADVSRIASEKYSDVPAMTDWLRARFGKEDIAWLDEVFADKTKQTQGNLGNFGVMINGMMDELGCNVLAYRTINQAMVRAAERDFGEAVQVFRADEQQVPDRRDFIIITRGETS